MENIYQDAFSSTAITELKLPLSVTQISVNAFANCKELKCVDIPENVIKISDNAFSKCSQLKDAYVHGTIPPVIPYNVGIFRGCAAPVNVHVKSGLKEIYETSLGWAYNVDNHQTVILDDLNETVTSIYKISNNDDEEVVMRVTGKVYIVKKNGKNYKKILK